MVPKNERAVTAIVVTYGTTYPTWEETAGRPWGERMRLKKLRTQQEWEDNVVVRCRISYDDEGNELREPSIRCRRCRKKFGDVGTAQDHIIAPAAKGGHDLPRPKFEQYVYERSFGGEATIFDEDEPKPRTRKKKEA